MRSSKFERLCVDLDILEENKCEHSSQHNWCALKDLEKDDMVMFNACSSVPNSYDQLKETRFCCSFHFRFCMFMRTFIFKH